MSNQYLLKEIEQLTPKQQELLNTTLGLLSLAKQRERINNKEALTIFEETRSKAMGQAQQFFNELKETYCNSNTDFPEAEATSTDGAKNESLPPKKV